MASVLVPLPERDFDPSEVAVSWTILTEAGHTVRFATPQGAPAKADDMMVTGQGLDPWGWIPGLRRVVGIGRVLRADSTARGAYASLTESRELTRPIAWDDIELDDFDGLLLPGGHRARGMRTYLESPHLQAVVVDAFARDLPVGAICHGVLLVARSTDPATGRSVLHGRTTTSLTWRQERLASSIGRISRFWDPGYYRTYLDGPDHSRGYMSVQAEVTRALARSADFVDVDDGAPGAGIKNDGRHRDRIDDEGPAHVVQDGRYVSARWPGDVHTFARRFASLLDGTDARPPLTPAADRRDGR